MSSFCYAMWLTISITVFRVSLAVVCANILFYATDSIPPWRGPGVTLRVVE